MFCWTGQVDQVESSTEVTCAHPHVHKVTGRKNEVLESTVFRFRSTRALGRGRDINK